MSPAGAPKLSQRTSGILLHPTSLPGPHGSGDLGAAARHFVDFLAEGGQSWWQMLPVGPPGYGDSPYSAHSAFAGNPYLVSLDFLAQEGLLEARDLAHDEGFPSGHVDWGPTRAFREKMLRRAHSAFRGSQRGFEAFCRANEEWLDAWALYAAIKREHGGVQWTKWPAKLRDRDPSALAKVTDQLAGEIAFAKFVQYEFERQWRSLREYAHGKGVGLIGDIPIFMAHDSADVWANRGLFRLDAKGEPEVIAGVPPDYFSATGQRWGNPLYRWKRMKRRGYAWWLDRFKVTLARVDVVRLDHFIGFQRYWEIPAKEPTAVNGRWMKGPGAPFFRALAKELRLAENALPLIAEDLGAVTPAVKRLRDRFGLPGIKLLQFAFGTDPSAPDFVPHVYPRNSVAYTGTHDNDTTVGWFFDAGGDAATSTRTPEDCEKERHAALAYLGAADGSQIHWDMIRGVQSSVANTAIVPLQDVLGLGSEARMNRPGRGEGNWTWRFEKSALSHDLAARLADFARIYGRQR